MGVREGWALHTYVSPPLPSPPTHLHPLNRLVSRSRRVNLEHCQTPEDGNCMYRSIAFCNMDLGVTSAMHHLGLVRQDLADFLEQFKDQNLSDGVTLGDAALAAVHDWMRPIDLPNDKTWPPTTIVEARAINGGAHTHTHTHHRKGGVCVCERERERESTARPRAHTRARAHTHARFGLLQVLRYVRCDRFWGDDFTRLLATLKYGVGYYVASSRGPEHDRPELEFSLDDDSPFLENYKLAQTRHAILSHMVLAGNGYHYELMRPSPSVRRVVDLCRAALTAAVTQLVGESAMSRAAGQAARQAAAAVATGAGPSAAPVVLPKTPVKIR